jgi:cell division protein FtsL
MYTIVELTIGAIALAWLAMAIGIAFVYVKIQREQREITRMKKKIDFHEESIKQITGSFVAIKGEHGII